MQDHIFKLNRPTLGMSVIDGVKIPVLIPQDATLTLSREIEENQLVDVIWEGRSVTIFSIDLRTRGTHLDAR